MKDIGIIKEVDYQTRLLNMVLINKSCEDPRMGISFTNINDACPKDYYPLVTIDQLVDLIFVYGIMSFINTYSIYHQIHMSHKYEEKMTIIAKDAIFYYTRMLFGLKNIGEPTKGW